MLKKILENKKKIIFFIQVLAFPFFIFLIFKFFRISKKSIGETIFNPLIEYWYVYLMLGIIYLAIYNLRWLYICQTAKIKTKLFKLSEFFFRSNLLNLTLPTSSGGDLIKIYLLTSEGLSFNKALSITFFEKICGILSLSIIGILCVLYNFTSYENIIIFTFIFCNILVFLLPLFFYLISKFDIKISFIKNFSKNILSINKNLRVLLTHAFLATSMHVPILFALYFHISFHEQLMNFTDIIPFLAASFILMVLPLSYGGHGLREGVFLLCFSSLTYSDTVIFSAAVAMGILLISYSLLGYSFYIVLNLIIKYKLKLSVSVNRSN